MRIVEARSPEQLAEARTLFAEYASALDVDLSFQGFEAKLATLPGAYAHPAGRILLALDGAAAAGCVALRPLEGRTCDRSLGFEEIDPYTANPVPGVRFLERRLA